MRKIIAILSSAGTNMSKTDKPAAAGWVTPERRGCGFFLILFCL